MKKILLLICLLYSFSYANTVPQGAFGINFGEELSKINIIKKLSNDSYEVKVPMPMNEYFKSYSVMIDEKSNKVLGIKGKKNYFSNYSCEKPRKDLIKLLKNKYKNLKELKEGVFFIGEIMISVECLKNEGKSELNLTYVDFSPFSEEFNKINDQLKELNDGEDILKGGFGINFGEKLSALDLKKGKITSSFLAKESNFYLVNPPKPLKEYLQDYAVGITPISKEVYAIFGYKHYNQKNESKCKDDKEKLINIFTKRYGQPVDVKQKEVMFMNLLGMIAVTVICQENELIVFYSDISAYDKHEKEQKTIELEKTNTDML